MTVYQLGRLIGKKAMLLQKTAWFHVLFTTPLFHPRILGWSPWSKGWSCWSKGWSRWSR